MPDPHLVAAYEHMRERHRHVAEELVPVLEEIAVAIIRDVLPAAHRLQVRDELNEDWIPTLRIQRVIDSDGAILFDSAFGHPDENVEELVDEVGAEYLDLLLDLTGDEYMGWKEIEA